MFAVYRGIYGLWIFTAKYSVRTPLHPHLSFSLPLFLSVTLAQEFGILPQLEELDVSSAESPTTRSSNTEIFFYCTRLLPSSAKSYGSLIGSISQRMNIRLLL